MPDKAQAGVLVGPRKVEIQEFDLPPTNDDDALLRIEACGICGSDIPPYQGDIHGEVGPLPVILGHEITGRVQNLGTKPPRPVGAWRRGTGSSWKGGSPAAVVNCAVTGTTASAGPQPRQEAL